MIVVTRFRVSAADPRRWRRSGATLHAALAALAARPGYVDGQVGRNVDDPDAVGAHHHLGERRLPTGARCRRTT